MWPVPNWRRAKSEYCGLASVGGQDRNANGSDHVDASSPRYPRRWTLTRRRRVPAIRYHRCGIGCGSCPFTENRNSVRMDTPRQETSCRQCRCRCVCGRVDVSNFTARCALGKRTRAPRAILDVRQKEGRSGPLIFVIVRHEIGDAEGIALSEEQDIVYRDNATAGEAKTEPGQAAPADAAWERVIRPDDVLLFRYSALTFNAHRIHYDRRYATEVGGYPGLVVHGPLIATLLLDLVRRNLPDAPVERFSFRAVSPLFDTEPFVVCGKPEGDGKTISLWAKDATGRLATTATTTRV